MFEFFKHCSFFLNLPRRKLSFLTTAVERCTCEDLINVSNCGAAKPFISIPYTCFRCEELNIYYCVTGVVSTHHHPYLGLFCTNLPESALYIGEGWCFNYLSGFWGFLTTHPGSKFPNHQIAHCDLI